MERPPSKYNSEASTAYQETYLTEIHRSIIIMHENGLSTKTISSKLGFCEPYIGKFIQECRTSEIEALVGNLFIKCKPNHCFTANELSRMKGIYKAPLDEKTPFRLTALLLWAQGVPSRKNAKVTELSESAVVRMTKKFRQSGLEAALTKKPVSYKSFFTPGQVSDIEAAYNSATDEWTKQRLKVLWLRARGVRDEEITKSTGYSGTSIRRLIWDYNALGLEFMTSTIRTGKRQYNARNFEFALEQMAELKSGYASAQDKRIAIKFKALLLRSEGNTIEKVFTETGLHKSYISSLIKRYRRDGISAIYKDRATRRTSSKERPYLAFKHKLTDEQKTEIRAVRDIPIGKRAAKRLTVLKMRSEEKSYKEISNVTGLHPTSISAILRRYQQNGLQYTIGDRHRNREHDK